ncbi:MAG TPA: peptidoglycan DD-metalloendopeptidase family protein [Xanthobacteraceae bacterium]|jgi:septal ring factor EnvC (AmiA/AmiB activator)
MIAVRRLSACAPMLLATAAALALAVGAAIAQTAAPTPKPTPDTVRQRGQELDAIRAEQQKADAAQQKLRDEIAALGEDRRKLNQALLDGAAGIRADEDKISATQVRLQQLTDNEARIRKSLDSRRVVIGEVLAVLQRMGRRPPPAMLVKPEDALESLRAAMLLGAVVPEMRGEVQSLAAQLTDLVHVRAQAASERDALARDRANLSVQQNRMSLLIGERQKRQADAQQQLDVARQHAADLARQAANLKDLIAKLEQAAPPLANDHAARSNLSALKDPGRLEPAIAFASAKGMLPIPVSGVKSRDFGSLDSDGGTEKGISIVTRPGAQVTSPCDGWVVYAAPYRSYGKLLILNAGGGYLVVLAGMEQISVDIGQFVLTGEPVAAMGSGPQVASSSVVTGAAGGSQPALYIEFRKDGTPVDPSPWWATPGSEKVRG